MDWAKAAEIATVFGTIIGLISFIVSATLILHQLREQTKLAKATNVQAFVETSSPFNLQLIQDRAMAELWVNGCRSYDTYDDVDRFRYRSLLIWWLILHENVYYQRRNGLLDESYYAAWNNDLKGFVKEQNLEKLWGGMKDSYQKEFVAHVDVIIEQTKERLK